MYRYYWNIATSTCTRIDKTSGMRLITIGCYEPFAVDEWSEDDIEISRERYLTLTGKEN